VVLGVGLNAETFIHNSTSGWCLNAVITNSHVSLQFADLQGGKVVYPSSFVGTEVGKSTFGNTDDSLRTGLYTFTELLTWIFVAWFLPGKAIRKNNRLVVMHLW
jgi:hypothetical protein